MTLQLVMGQLGRLQRRALEADSDKIRRHCIITADTLVIDLLLIGAIDEAEADQLMRGWVEGYARERLQAAPIPERLLALWQGGDVADFLPALERADMIRETSRTVVGA